MLSFRSILITVATFATLTSAIATLPPINIRGGNGGGGVVQVDSGGIQDGMNFLGGHTGGAGAGGPDTRLPTTNRGQSASPADILKTCSDGVELVVEIDAAVNVDGCDKNLNLNHNLLIYHLGEIVDLLKVALKDLKKIDVAELTLNGAACTLSDLAGIVAGLLILVMKAVWPVLSTVGFVDIDLCSITASIGVLMCTLLEVVFALVDDNLKVEVVLLIRQFVSNATLHITARSWLSLVSKLKRLFLTSI